jgi:hypothetical protein
LICADIANHYEFAGLDNLHATAQSKSNYPKILRSMRLKNTFSNWIVCMLLHKANAIIQKFFEA